MMTTLPKIALTPRRREALALVQRELVKFRVSTADYIVEGEAVGGWDRRTFSDLRLTGLITYTDGAGDREVRLTKAARQLLKSAIADTPVADSP